MAYIRSNDMFRAYPLNAGALAELQVRVASKLGDVGIGTLAILSFSAHIYSDCWAACEPAMAEAARLRGQFEPDPRGSFVLRIEECWLLADHYSIEGDLIQTIRARNGKELVQLLSPLVSRVDHAAYLGKEAHRLQCASANREAFEQDEV